MSKQKGAIHTAQINRLNRIEGQVRGLSRMIEDQRYCIDILNQIKAVKSALSSVEQNIVEQHLNHCLHTAVSSKDRRKTEEMFNEIKGLLKKTK